MSTADYEDVPVPTFDRVAFTSPPRLDRARVGIVTTAGLCHPEQEGWGRLEESFRLLDATRRDLKLVHLSPNFDRTGFAMDLNVAYPIDRLNEMAAAGTIGGVGPRHISFMGALNETMATIRLDTGPAAARVFQADGVDVVLLVPI